MVRRYLTGDSCIKIAQEMGVAKPSVLRALKAAGVKRRSPYENRKGPRQPPVSKDELEGLYIAEKTRTKHLAERYEVTAHTVLNWLRYYGIPVRSNGEELALIPCHEHSCWKGGLTPLRDALFGRLIDWKQKVRTRDRWKCTRCPSNSELEVHHVKPLRTIIAEFHEAFPSIDLTRSEDFDFALKTIVQVHTPEIGVTLCDKCHCDVDEYRARLGHRPKNK